MYDGRNLQPIPPAYSLNGLFASQPNNTGLRFHSSRCFIGVSDTHPSGMFILAESLSFQLKNIGRRFRSRSSTGNESKSDLQILIRFSIFFSSIYIKMNVCLFVCLSVCLFVRYAFGQSTAKLSRNPPFIQDKVVGYFFPENYKSSPPNPGRTISQQDLTRFLQYHIRSCYMIVYDHARSYEKSYRKS
jgi:hypothetical protein